jgi:predicted metal-dependent phosphoesterase TrpH
MAVVNLVEDSVSSKPNAQDALALKGVFESIHTESCPRSFNFHMHTVCSDGQLQPEALMEQAIAIGLQGFAITDHHTVDGYQRAKSWLANYTQANPDRVGTLPHLWTGFEVTARLLETEVHILGYAFDVAHAAIEPYVQKHAPQDAMASAAQVIASIQMAGGLAVLAHPVRYRRSAEDLIAAASTLGINGVETYYAYDNPSPWRTSPRQTEQVQRLSSTYGLLNTCGSDTHGLSLLQRL